MERFPFGIPNSWYVVAYSHELGPGKVKRMRYLERDLVAFRGESGSVAVLDAYCPHLGAHLGVGGEVVGDTIRCPFHAWRWHADGSCAEIPYAKRIPEQARAEHLPVVERNGMIFVWYHAEGAPPDFEVPDIAEWHREDWVRPWLVWEWTLSTHPQEMAENALDWAHFEKVHLMDVPGNRGAEFGDHSFSWHVGGTKEVSTLGDLADELTMHGENWGMGYSWLKQEGHFETVVATGLTPIDRETTHVRMGVIGSRGERDEETARRELRSYMEEHAVFAEQDFAIWENKKYRPRPLLCDGDGPIGEYRRWAARFY